MKNSMRVEFPANSDNERFARNVAASFILELDPTLDELSEIKTAVSEAVTNAIIHGYGNNEGVVIIEGMLFENIVMLTISDHGKGIADIELARKPFYTESDMQERSGMGFTVMETFMDSVDVESIVGVGTKVIMKRKIGKNRF